MLTSGLTGKRVLVTGGTKGIGKAVVELLMAEGAKVITSARLVDVEMPGVILIAADLSTREGCDVLIAAVQEQFGGVDIMIHVLGGSSAPGGGFAALDEEHWQQELSLNLLPAVRLDRALLPECWRARKGLLSTSPPSRVGCHCRNLQQLTRRPKPRFRHTAKACRKRFRPKAFA